MLTVSLSIPYSDAQRMVEKKQKRIDDIQRALQLIRSACVVWPNAASEVLLVGSFDGWTNQVWLNLLNAWLVFLKG